MLVTPTVAFFSLQAPLPGTWERNFPIARTVPAPGWDRRRSSPLLEGIEFPIFRTKNDVAEFKEETRMRESRFYLFG